MMIGRNGRHYPQAAWAQWRDGVVRQMRYQFLASMQKPFIDGHVFATIEYWPGDKRRRDVPGMIDALWHCIERAGIVKDDSMIESLEWFTKGYDLERPRVEICLIPNVHGLR